MRYLFSLCLVLALGFSTGTQASVNTLPFQNAEQEQRFNHLIEELRCLVCQNQNLADSNAGLASDLRIEVYNMILQGKSDQEILDFMVNRYGDFVLYRPPVKSSTYLLWAGPFLLLILAAISVMIFIRKRERVANRPITESEQQRLQDLLDRDQEGPRT